MSPSNNLGSHAERNARFEHLMDIYLERKATDAEKAELNKMIEEGFSDRFKERFDETINSDLGTGDMSEQSRQEILLNILHREAEPKPSGVKWRWAVAAAVLILASAAGWYVLRSDMSGEKTIAQEQVDTVSLKVYTGKQFVKLPDGSTALLNANSELSFLPAFDGRVREVILKGEAFFDVQYNPNKPFKVITEKVTTTVLGTAFNVQAYPGNAEIKVTVSRGKVQVAKDNKTLGVITPDQQIAVNTQTNSFVQTNTKAETVTAWKDKYLILDDVTLETAAAIIEGKYNAKITFSNNDLKNCRFTATFLYGENLEQVLTVVSGMSRANYQVLSDGTIKIFGPGCK